MDLFNLFYVGKPLLYILILQLSLIIFITFERNKNLKYFKNKIIYCLINYTILIFCTSFINIEGNIGLKHNYTGWKEACWIIQGRWKWVRGCWRTDSNGRRQFIRNGGIITFYNWHYNYNDENLVCNAYIFIITCNEGLLLATTISLLLVQVSYPQGISVN